MSGRVELPLTLSDVQRARQRIASCVRRTPLVPSVTLSERLKTNVYVKLELFQKTGSFKVRGVFNKALSLASEIPAKGLVTVSGGNNALAVAYTGRALDLAATVLMPENSPQTVQEATRGYGAAGEIRRHRGRRVRAGSRTRARWLDLHPSL